MLLLRCSTGLGKTWFCPLFTLCSDWNLRRYNGLNYCITIFVADTSSLKNRSLMFAYASSPYIITVWVGGPIANWFLKHSTFRWAFGMWAILTPFITMPLWFLFMYNVRKAEKMGKIVSSLGYWMLYADYKICRSYAKARKWTHGMGIHQVLRHRVRHCRYTHPRWWTGTLSPSILALLIPS